MHKITYLNTIRKADEQIALLDVAIEALETAYNSAARATYPDMSVVVQQIRDAQLELADRRCEVLTDRSRTVDRWANGG